MINVIHAGSADSFDFLLYPEQNPANCSYIQNQLQQFGQGLTDVGRSFMEAARGVYDKINSGEMMRMAQATLRAAKGVFHPNNIVPLETLEQLQNAQPIMQRWIMACPAIRELHQEQRCAGFSDTYVDFDPGTIGDNHYDYRRVMNGMVVEDGDTWFARTYSDDLVPGDRELNFDERVNIISTWDYIKMFVEGGRDPSDPFAGDL